MKKIDIKLYVMACMLLVSSLSFGQLKFGDKSTVGQTLTLNNTTGVATVDLTFNTDKSLSSIVLNADSAAKGTTYYDISIAKCQTNKGFQVNVYDESNTAIVNGDFKCYRWNSYENPVHVASIDSLVSILDAYGVNDPATSTSKQKPAHCLFDITADNQAFGAWPGKYKKVEYGFYVDFSGKVVNDDITFEIDTYDEGNTSATASYDLIISIGSDNNDPDTLKNFYVTGSGIKQVSLATDAGFPVDTFTNTKVYFWLKTTGTGTTIADDSFDPTIVVDNLKVNYNPPSWVKPAAGIEANVILTDKLRGNADEEITFEIPLKYTSRMGSLKITNDLQDNTQTPLFTFMETGALKANDGNGNYTVDVPYTFTDGTYDAGTGTWSKAQIVVAAPAEGSVDDDMMFYFKATPTAFQPKVGRLELDNGTRIWLDISINSRPPYGVAYVNEDQTMASTNKVDNDPIVQMMKMDSNFDIDVIVIKKDSIVDLSGYDIVVVQETFGSGDAIYTPSGILGLENINVPFIYNKAYALRDGKAITDKNSPVPAAVDPGFLPYLYVQPDSQANALFSGITFDGDSVLLFKSGAADDGSAGSKAMQYVTNLDIVGEGNVTDLQTMLGMIKGKEDDATAKLCVNIIPAGTLIGEQDTIKAQMIAISQNYGAICKDGNMTDANLTLWRNAFYLAAGLEVPTDPVVNTTDVDLTVSSGMVAKNSTAGSFQVTVPKGTTSVDLTADVVKGTGVNIPVIDGLTDGQNAEYDLYVYTIGMDSVAYKVYVHVQSAEEILYLSADGSGVPADAKKYDVNVYGALVSAGYSVTFAKKGSLGSETQPRTPFDYSPYTAMVIAPGESSSNILVFAQDEYPIPCVSMQPDAPRKTKWGWISTDSDDNIEMNVTKVYDQVDSIKMSITNNTHYITTEYQIGDLIQWNNGTPDSADWSGKEVKSYNLSTAVPTAIPLGRIAADGTSLTSWWAVPMGSVLNTRYKDETNTTQYKEVETKYNIVILNVYSDGLLYATPEGAEMLLNSLNWVMRYNNCVFEPYYSDLENLTPDPECTDLSLWNGWGLKSVVTGAEAYCGETSFLLVDTAGTNDCSWPDGDAALDISSFAWQPNTTYHLRAMVKTIGGTIGFLAKGSVDNTGLTNDFNFSFDSHGEWMQIDTMFTTSDSPTTNFYSFNTCDNSTATETYIDNYELYALPEVKPKVAYVTESKVMAETATQPSEDPIITMLMADDNFEVDTFIVANDSVFDLSGYDVVVGQEPFSSSSAIWQRGGSLGMGSLTVPHIINKVYSMKAGRAFETGTAGSGGEQASDLYLHVDAANQANDLFKGLTFEGDSIKIFKAGYADDGSDDGSHFKGLQYATDVAFVPANSPLALSTMAPSNATVGINYLATGDSIGSELMLAPMYTMCMNYGAICGNGGDNITGAGLTIWRNAVYMLAGLPVPEEAIGTSIKDVNKNVSTVSVYPNPARDVVNISFGLDRKTEVSLSVYTVSGQLVDAREGKLYESGENRIVINTSDMKDGLYIYRLTVGEESYKGILSITK